MAQRRGLVDAEFAVGRFKYRGKVVVEICEVDGGEIGIIFCILDGDIGYMMVREKRAENGGVAAFVHDFHLIIPRVRIVARGPSKVGPAHEDLPAGERGGVVEEGTVEKYCIPWCISGDPGGCLIISRFAGAAARRADVGKSTLGIVEDDEKIDESGEGEKYYE